MRIKREEAFDLIRKFADESALVECSLRFPTFSARFRGRMVSFDGIDLRVISDDTRSEIVLRIAPWMEFGFGDASSFFAHLHYNFVRIHQTLRVTPAMCGGIDRSTVGNRRHSSTARLRADNRR
jgi:hypothetical protein